MKRIVVGVDSSPEAAAALRWACREGRLRDVEVVAVMAWGYLDQYRGLSQFEPYADQTSASAALERFTRDTVGPDDAARLQLHAVDGFASGALLEAAEDAALLVVGARGAGGFAALRLGSVSRQCLHHSPCPVTIVRAGQPPGTTGVEHIVVGFDGSESSHEALAWALDEARLRSARVTVVHAWTPAIVGSHPYGVAALDPLPIESAARRALDAAISNADTSDIPGIRAVTPCGPPARALVEYADGADLLVVGSRGAGPLARLVLGSVADHVAHHAPCPVVVYRRQ
ncbi:MAG TPA: universal stress protein [Acidimicrobiales bacterium]